MGKKGKIGKDILRRSGTITSKKDSEEYQKFLEERERKRLEEIKERMKEEGQPSNDEIARARAKEAAELNEAKQRGELEPEEDEEKPVNVKKHRRRKPRREF